MSNTCVNNCSNQDRLFDYNGSTVYRSQCDDVPGSSNELVIIDKDNITLKAYVDSTGTIQIYNPNSGTNDTLDQAYEDLKKYLDGLSAYMNRIIGGNGDDGSAAKAIVNILKLLLEVGQALREAHSEQMWASLDGYMDQMKNYIKELESSAKKEFSASMIQACVSLGFAAISLGITTCQAVKVFRGSKEAREIKSQIKEIGNKIQNSVKDLSEKMARNKGINTNEGTGETVDLNGTSAKKEKTGNGDTNQEVGEGPANKIADMEDNKRLLGELKEKYSKIKDRELTKANVYTSVARNLSETGSNAGAMGTAVENNEAKKDQRDATEKQVAAEEQKTLQGFHGDEKRAMAEFIQRLIDMANSLNRIENDILATISRHV